MSKNKVIDTIRNLSIFLKIVILFETVLIVVVVFFTLFATRQFNDTIKEKELVLGNINVERVTDYMREKYQSIYDLSNYIHNGNISEHISKIKDNPDSIYDYKVIGDFNVFADAIFAADTDVSDVILVPTRGISYSNTRKPYANVKANILFLDNENVKNFMQSDSYIEAYYENPSIYCLRERKSVVSFMGKIYDASLFPHKELVGLWIVNIPVDAIEQKMVKDNEHMQGDISLFNRHGQILYHSNRENIGRQTELTETDYKNDYSFEKTIPNIELTARYRLSNAVLYRESRKLNQKVMLVLFLAISFTMIISYLIYKTYSNRIKILLNSMNRIEKAEFKLRIPVDSKDEIGAIGASFNQMCERLDNYITRVYETELQLKVAELNALQEQINPHFLYNTLESIKAKALEEGDKITPEMIALLGNLFRWSSHTDEKFVILEEELEYVRTYLKLQSYRYEENMEICISAEEVFLDYAVPKLILQPIVENIIKYAFACHERPGLAGILVRKKQDNLEITVYDNGCGMTKEYLDNVQIKLNTAKKQDEFESIGIQNVHQRLRLLFGESYGLQIRSVWGQGTAVKIVLPALSKEEMVRHVQVVNN